MRFIILTKTVNNTCVEMVVETESVIRDTGSFVNTGKTTRDVPKEVSACFCMRTQKKTYMI